MKSAKNQQELIEPDLQAVSCKRPWNYVRNSKSNVDAATPMRLASTELQKTLELRAQQQPAT